MTLNSIVKHLSTLVACFGLIFVHSAHCLHEDQVGKFDWRKQFIGVPKFVYQHSDADNLIIGTESNIVASIQPQDGSIIWRQRLPADCNIHHMSVLRSKIGPSDYLVQTSCEKGQQKKLHLWEPRNGLLASEDRKRELVDDDQSESVLSNQGHLVDTTRIFTLSNDVNLHVADDGKVSFKVFGKVSWSREESLASVIAAEIVKLPSDMRDRFGLKKIIVALTQGGKIFGLDTITGDIVWQLFERELSTNYTKLALLVLTRQSDESAADSRAIIINPVGILIEINPVLGTVVERRTYLSIRQVAQTELNPVDGSRGILLLDDKGKVHVYPESVEPQVRDNLDKYYITVVEEALPRVEGYRIVSEQEYFRAELVWTFPIKKTDKIVSLKNKRIDEEVHSPARVLGDRGILYKYTNPNLLAIMTQGSQGDICSQSFYVNIFLVDGVTGALVHSAHHPKSRGPAQMVHSENWLVYSYFNTKSRRTELSSLEMFEGTSQTNSTSFSSLTRSAIKPKLIEHKTFIFPSGINAMIDTTTLRGMTNKNIIVALGSGALLEIPKVFLDPRRPINMLVEHREEGLIPYMPELLIPSESIINYDRTLMAIRKITTSPAILESTSLVFAYGLDLYFTRVTPSKTFDILKDDFDHVLITAVLIFLVVASYVCKMLAQRKALRAAWK